MSEATTPHVIHYSQGFWYQPDLAVPEEGKVVLVHLAHGSKPSVMRKYGLATFRPEWKGWNVDGEPDFQKWGWYITAWCFLPPDPIFWPGAS